MCDAIVLERSWRLEEFALRWWWWQASPFCPGPGIPIGDGWDGWMLWASCSFDGTLRWTPKRPDYPNYCLKGPRAYACQNCSQCQDCIEGRDNWREGWSDDKKDWWGCPDTCKSLSGAPFVECLGCLVMLGVFSPLCILALHHPSCCFIYIIFTVFCGSSWFMYVDAYSVYINLAHTERHRLSLGQV